MSAAHTAAPWRLVKNARGWSIKAKDGCVLATVHQFPDGAELAPQCEHNAKLMAAAPDLSEASASFLNWFQGFVGAAGYAEINCKELTDLQAALAKAGAT